MNKQIKGKNKNEKNYLHGKAPNKQKEEQGIFLVFFVVLQLTMLGRKSKGSRKYFCILSRFFEHTRRRRENKSSMDNTMKKCGYRQLE